MSLYVRVYNSFYTHRKTMRLRSTLGDSALWLPPRLWAYAAENQSDGCFKDYSAQELAMLLGCLTDAKAMLEALLQAGFMDADPLRIHDWADHNGYHERYAERARKGGLAKAAKALQGNEMKGEERERRQAVLDSAKSTASSSQEEAETDGFVKLDSIEANIPSLTEFGAAFITEGIPPEYIEKQWGYFEGNQEWLNKHGRLKDWRFLVRQWWARDRTTWGKPTQGGKRKHNITGQLLGATRPNHS